jgi:hypothetical protein
MHIIFHSTGEASLPGRRERGKSVECKRQWVDLPGYDYCNGKVRNIEDHRKPLKWADLSDYIGCFVLSTCLTVSSGIVPALNLGFEFYGSKVHRISMVGRHVPSSCESFIVPLCLILPIEGNPVFLSLFDLPLRLNGFTFLSFDSLRVLSIVSITS